MKSVNHQFLEFSDQVVQRWVKARLQPITGLRLNPRNSVNPNERIEFLLATPEDNVEFIEYDKDGNGEPTRVKQTKFTYEDEVLELYTTIEIRAFERMNRQLIENGLLVEYSESSPAVNKVNTLSDVELRKIAKLKSITAFNLRIADITSVVTLETLLEVLDTVETATLVQVRAVRDRIKELNNESK